jgi:hypothetical protein
MKSCAYGRIVLHGLWTIPVALWAAGPLAAAPPRWENVPAGRWAGRLEAEVAGLDGGRAAAIAHPAGQAEGLSMETDARPA